MATRNPNSNSAVPDSLGRYQIVREIARSNDIVYEARDPRINRRVALKELNLDFSLSVQAQHDRTERFYREARAAGKLTHPNIVTILDIAEYNNRHYIAMEYLEGETLRKRINTLGALPLHQVLVIGIALCDALEYAHRYGVVHRDIKPDNVHILPGFDTAAVGAQGVVKLTDFGIARITDEVNLTMAGQVFGTPSYMSPEQIRGEEIDARSDLFSLGVMLHECITGRKPFTGDTIATITHGLLYNPTPPLSGVPSQLDEAIRRATMKRREDRFLSAVQMKAALLAALSTRTLSPNGSPLIAPNLPQIAPQRTVAYGSQTQMGVAPGLNTAPQANVMPSPALPPNSVPYPSSLPNPTWNQNSQSAAPQTAANTTPLRPSPLPRILSLLALLIAIGGLSVVVGNLFQRASKNYQRQNVYSHDMKILNEATRLHNSGKFLEAVQLFEKLRSTNTQSEIQENATKGALYAYRELGHQAQNTNDWTKAIQWYTAALNVKPDDAQARQEYDTARRYLESTRPAEPLPTPGPAEKTTQFPSRPAAGTPNVNASDFTNVNSRAAQEAQQYLQQGNDALAKGDQKAALEFWGKAVEAGPGSDASNQALQLQNKYQSNGF